MYISSILYAMLAREDGIGVAVFSFFVLVCYSAAISFNLASAESVSSMLLREKIKIGELKQKGGDFEQAIAFFQEGLVLAEGGDYSEAELHCVMHLGILNWNKGQYDESQKYHLKALIKARQLNLKTKQEEAQAFLDIYKLYSDGYDFYSAGNYKESIETLNKAINLTRKIGSQEQEVKCLRIMSLNFWEQENYYEFFNFNISALKIARILNHKKEEMGCLNNTGLYYIKIDDLSNALKDIGESLLIARELKDIKMESYCLNNLGIIYENLGNPEKALEYYMKSLVIDRQLNDKRNIAKDLNNVGIAYQETRKYSNNQRDISKALDYYSESLGLAQKSGDKKTEINVLNNIGQIYTNLNNAPVALKYFQIALEAAKSISDKEVMGHIYNNMGSIYYDKKEYSRSSVFYGKAIALATQLKSGRILWEAYFGLGQCCEKEKNYSEALANYQKSIEIIDSIRSQLYIDNEKAGFVRDKLKVYECYIDLLFSLGGEDKPCCHNKSIFSVVEKAKARAFLENLKEARVNIQESWSPALKNQEEQISKIISANVLALSRHSLSEMERKKLWESLKDAEDGYMRFISKARLESPKAAGLAFTKPCSVDEVQSLLLDEKSALIEYFLGDNRSYLFFITKTRFELYELTSRQIIENSLNAYLKTFYAPSRDIFMGDLAARRLLEELLFPLKKGITENLDRLIIIPDGILHYLPFEALQLDNQRTYLIEKFKISYAPSSSSLLYLSKVNAGENSQFRFLGIGDPIYFPKMDSRNMKAKISSGILRDLFFDDGFDLSPLPNSRKEILKIARYFPKDQRRICLGKEAREEVIKKSSIKDFQIIHFACHGFLDEKVPYRSALVLSTNGDSQEDGFLQVREIYNLRMRANLVVLSACQTGRGTLERNEGILGLPRIFFYSGAKSVISTLWRINDKSTVIFMNDFYNYLSRGKDKAEALRLAKLNMLKSRYAHPFYWAAFILNGDSRSRLKLN